MNDINTTGLNSRDANELLRKNLKNNPDSLNVTSESPVIASELKHILENANYSVEITDDEGKILLIATRENSATNPYNSDNDEPEKAEILKSEQIPISDYDFESESESESEQIPVSKIESQISPAKFRTAYIFSNTNFSRNKNFGLTFLNRSLQSIAKLDHKPDLIVLLNEAVKLALYNTSSCDTLKFLERNHTRILVSGLCSDTFGITETVGAGIIAELDEIFYEISGCERVISL